MITIKNKQFRHIQEQVQKNKEDIAQHYDATQALANFGIKIVGTIENINDLPNPETYTGEFGDGYAVGTPGNYGYYIYTRPDPNAGQPNNYWLFVGNISVVGPQGIQGPQGERGPAGESTKWYFGEDYPTAANEGDMLLTMSGDVYRYQDGWQLQTNIKGPQGIQGIQGKVGPKGDRGEQGPQGQPGPAGGFITISGIIASTSQLPSPQSLNNLNIAYLIGSASPYNLYIQVGESVETAQWQNVGPFNIGTAVTEGGEIVSTFDADTKLNKIEPNYNDATFTYVAKRNSEGVTTQTYLDTSPNAVYNTIPLRDGYNSFRVGNYQEGMDNGYCANIKYVDAKMAEAEAQHADYLEKSNFSSSPYWTQAMIRRKTSEGGTFGTINLSTASEGGTVMLRTNAGTAGIAMHPYDIKDFDITNVKYVKDTIKALIKEHVYPVGCILETFDISMFTLIEGSETQYTHNTFGGTWEKISGRFILGEGEGYALNETGGYRDAAVISHTHNATWSTNATLGNYNSYIPMVNSTSEASSQVPGSIKSTGVDGAGRNMPPYKVAYIMTRIL